MIRQTVMGFKLENTEEELTAHGGLALMAEYTHGLGLRELVDRHLPEPGSNRGYAPSVFVDNLVLMLQGGGRSLEDLRELDRRRSPDEADRTRADSGSGQCGGLAQKDGRSSNGAGGADRAR